MMRRLLILSSLVVGAAVPTSANTISTVPPPPTAPGAPAERVTYLTSATVKHGTTTLWRGDLHLSSDGTAYFRQSVEESFACTGQSTGRPYFAQFRNPQGGSGIELTLTARPPNNRFVEVRVSFSRPVTPSSPASACNGQAVAGKIEIAGLVPARVGPPVTLRGDGALSVTVQVREVITAPIEGSY
jgi:hypothetical protein